MNPSRGGHMAVVEFTWQYDFMDIFACLYDVFNATKFSEEESWSTVCCSMIE